jgi:hypothetical protein
MFGLALAGSECGPLAGFSEFCGEFSGIIKWWNFSSNWETMNLSKKILYHATI